MRKLLNSPWVVAGLALVAFLLVGWSLYRQLGPESGHIPTGAGDELELAAGDPGTDQPDGAPPRTLRAALLSMARPENLSDPFAPRASELRPQEPRALPKEPDLVEVFQVSAIWKQGDTLLVVVNGQICRSGDRVGRLTVESAGLDGIWITHWRGRDFLPLGGSFTLVTPAERAAETLNTKLHEG